MEQHTRNIKRANQYPQIRHFGQSRSGKPCVTIIPRIPTLNQIPEATHILSELELRIIKLSI